MAELAALFCAFYLWHGLGVTIGYHRLLAHRSFACSKPVEYFFVLAGYLAFQGSPIWWATIHRAHHRYTDTQLDPHAPKFNMFNAHLGWLMRSGYAEHVNPTSQSRDLTTDAIYKFLEQDGKWHSAHRLAFLIGVAFRLLIWAVFGWQVALISILAAFAVWQIPFMLNVVCHLPRLGYKNFDTEDDSVNVWWVGLLALGEGWHNNHHAHPGSAKSGFHWFEFDLSWLIIAAMERCGLTRQISPLPGATFNSSSRSTRTHVRTGLKSASTNRSMRNNRRGKALSE